MFDTAFDIDDVRMGVNYGLNRVRFTAPVPRQPRARAFRAESYEPMEGGAQLTVEARSSSKARPSRPAWRRRCRAASPEPPQPGGAALAIAGCIGGPGEKHESVAGRRPSADPVGAADRHPGHGRRRHGAGRGQRRRGARRVAQAMPTSTSCCSTWRWATPTVSTCWPSFAPPTRRCRWWWCRPPTAPATSSAPSTWARWVSCPSARRMTNCTRRLSMVMAGGDVRAAVDAGPGSAGPRHGDTVPGVMRPVRCTAAQAEPRTRSAPSLEGGPDAAPGARCWRCCCRACPTS